MPEGEILEPDRSETRVNCVAQESSHARKAAMSCQFRLLARGSVSNELGDTYAYSLSVKIYTVGRLFQMLSQCTVILTEAVI